MIGEFLKISAIVIILLGICILFKSYRPEYNFLLTVSVSAVIATVVLVKVYPSVKILENMYYISSGNRNSFTVVIKALVISYISGFCGDACRDFGQTALAQKVEFAGRCAIFVLTVPVLTTVLETAMGFVGV